MIPFSPIFAAKTVIFDRYHTFLALNINLGAMTEITFLPGNNYPDSHHSLGGMKFATQSSPLLNLQVTIL